MYSLPSHAPKTLNIHRTVVDDFDYALTENGLVASRLGVPLESQSFIKFIGEERYKVLANFILHYIADMDIPVKRFRGPCKRVYL